MAKKSKSRWGEKEREACKQLFDLFKSTGGKEGWDPNNTETNYIIGCFSALQSPHKEVLQPYLSEAKGGDKGNRDNQKAVGGYTRAAGEWFVALAKSGVRASTSCPCRDRFAL